MKDSIRIRRLLAEGACKRKARFPTRAKAQKSADASNREKHTTRIHVYGCVVCGGYHLTSGSGTPLPTIEPESASLTK